jgi:ribonuclease Z
MENFSVTILGSSSASPTSQRNTTSQLVNFFDRLYLIDCGEGTQTQLRRNHTRLSKINHIFISHLHGDHFFGLAGLISSLNLFGRNRPLHIYSDPRIKQVIDIQLEISETVLLFEIEYHPLNFRQKELIFEDKKLEIFSFPLEHRVPTCGFLFQEKPSAPNVNKKSISKYDLSVDQIKSILAGKDLLVGNGEKIANSELVIQPNPPRSYAFCSDTKYFDSLYQNFEHVNLLYTECTFMNDLQEVAHQKFHMTTQDVAQLAVESAAKKLIVGHFSARYRDTTLLQSEIQSLYPQTILVNDFDTFFINNSEPDS